MTLTFDLRTVQVLSVSGIAGVERQQAQLFISCSAFCASLHKASDVVIKYHILIFLIWCIRMFIAYIAMCVTYVCKV